MAVYGRALTEVGLLVYLLTMPVGPALPAWGREIPILAMLLGMCGARFPFRSDPSAAPPFRFLVPVSLFAASALASTALSTFVVRSVSRSAYVPIALLLFLAVQEVVITPRASRRIRWALTIVVGLLGLDGVSQFATGSSWLTGTLPYSGRVTGSLPHPNDLALIPILAPLSLSLLPETTTRWGKALVLSGLPLAFTTVVLSQSRNAWLGLAVGLGCLLTFSRSRGWILAAGGVALGVFAVAYALDAGHVRSHVLRVADVARDPRVALWLVAWRMFAESPLIGKGVHTFQEFHLPYLRQLELPAGIDPHSDTIPWAHNLYLEILAERGLLGLVGYGAPLLAMVATLGRYLGRETPPEARTAALGLSASLAVFLVLGLFDLTFLKDWVLLVFFLLAALTARLPVLRDAVAAGRPG